MKRKMIIVIILIIALIGGGGIAFYYSYQNSHYVSTDNAQIASNLVTISPEVAGKISGWNVKVGDDVKAGQVLGRQDTGSLITSSAMNSQALNTAADAIASKTEIKSPIDGKVVQTNVVEGQMVAPGTGVAIVADTANVYVNANIKETNILSVKTGQKVEITVDAYPGKTFVGYVENIGQAAGSVFSILPTQNASGNFTKVTQLMPVKIGIINDANATLMPGMNVTVKIHLK